MECQKGQMNIQMVGRNGQMVRYKGEIKDIWLDKKEQIDG